MVNFTTSLFSFCIIHSVLSSFLSSERSLLHKEAQADEEELNASLWAIKALNSMNFYGTWKTYNKDSRLLNNFTNEEGFVILGSMGTMLLKDQYVWHLMLLIHDGEYIDNDYLEIRSIQNMSNFVFDSSRLSFNRKNLMLNVVYGRNQNPSFSTLCLSDIEVRLENAETGKPYDWKQGEQKTLNIGAKINLQSSNCSLSVQTEILSNSYTPNKNQLIVFGVVTVVYVMLGIQVNKRILGNYPYRAYRNVRISLWSLLLVNYYDIYLMLFNFITASMLNRWFTFVAFLIFMTLVIPEASAVYTVFISETNFVNPRFSFKHLFIYYILLLFLISFTISIKSIWIDFISGIFLFPQIIHSFMEGKRSNIPFRYILLSAITRILLMIYLKVYQDNVYKFSPNIIFASTYIGLILFQVLILVIQHWYPRLCFKNRKFDYEVDLKTTEEKLEPCPICMENLGEPSLDSKKGLLEEDHQATLFETPCKHRFHAKCLKEWMKRKFECPFCKRPLPHISIESNKSRMNEFDGIENGRSDTF